MNKVKLITDAMRAQVRLLDANQECPDCLNPLSDREEGCDTCFIVKCLIHGSSYWNYLFTACRTGTTMPRDRINLNRFRPGDRVVHPKYGSGTILPWNPAVRPSQERVQFDHGAKLQVEQEELERA